jgi:hypothetical protein
MADHERGVALTILILEVKFWFTIHRLVPDNALEISCGPTKGEPLGVPCSVRALPESPARRQLHLIVMHRAVI